VVSPSIPTTDEIPIHKKPYRYGFEQRDEIKNRHRSYYMRKLSGPVTHHGVDHVRLVPKKMYMSGKQMWRLVEDLMKA